MKKMNKRDQRISIKLSTKILQNLNWNINKHEGILNMFPYIKILIYLF